MIEKEQISVPADKPGVGRYAQHQICLQSERFKFGELFSLINAY